MTQGNDSGIAMGRPDLSILILDNHFCRKADSWHRVRFISAANSPARCFAHASPNGETIPAS